MKKLSFLMLLVSCLTLLASCNDYETYSDMKKKERNAISKFLADSAISVISEAQFEAQGQTTDLRKNEFVYLEKSAIYMQIVRKGCGTPVQDGKTENVLCRFCEVSVETDSVTIRNDIPGSVYISSMGQYIDVTQYVDKLSINREGSTFSASFVSGMMLNYYGSSSVPAGWLVPLLYVNVGRPQSFDDEIAKVRIIVPHSQGTQSAMQYVTPYFYTITYQRDL